MQILIRFSKVLRHKFFSKVAKGFDSDLLTLLTGMILIDLKKAFDAIDHKILIAKNEMYELL